MTSEEHVPANKDDILNAIGDITINFAFLEDAINTMVSYMRYLLPPGTELYQLKAHDSFSRKAEKLKLYVNWYFREADPHGVLLLDTRGHDLIAHLGVCQALAKERNKYVHAILYHFDPRTIFKGDVARNPTFTFRAAQISGGEDVVVPVTSSVLEQMHELSRRISLAWGIAADHIGEIRKAYDTHRERTTPKPGLGFGLGSTSGLGFGLLPPPLDE